jgi:hypothetical protein
MVFWRLPETRPALINISSGVVQNPVMAEPSDAIDGCLSIAESPAFVKIGRK